MTVEELIQAAINEFNQTTVGMVNTKWKTPPPGTYWYKGLGYLEQALNPVVPPPTKTVKVIWNFEKPYTTDWSKMQALGLNTLFADASDLTTLKMLASQGDKAWAQPGFWNGSGFTLSDAQAVAVAKAAWATGAIDKFYLSDEPSSGASLIKARSDLIKQACPGAQTIMSTWDPTIVSSFAHVTDFVALDGYPNRQNFDMSVITKQAAAADRVAWPYFGIVGAFGSSAPGATYVLPTATQLKQMFDTWKATNMLGLGIYAWGPEVSVSNSKDYLENHQELLDVIAQELAA